jgi:hypothetical protein
MDADSSLDHIFFPDSGVVSVVAVYADGSVIEMATIGREGCTGVHAFFGARGYGYQTTSLTGTPGRVFCADIVAKIKTASEL